MSEHTPGPWNWLHYSDGRKLLMGPMRAVIHCPDAPMTCEELDARLIAAAPDLLASCIWIQVAMRGHVESGGGDYSESAARRDLAVLDVAIAKAVETADMARED